MKTSFRTLSRLAILVLVAARVFLAPASAQSASAAPSTPSRPAIIYTLVTSDKLRVTVYQEENLAWVSRVDAKGNINLQLIGQVQVAGLTVEQAQRKIEAAYRDGRILRNPQVTITIEEYAPREVTIQGEVISPGRYTLPIESTMTILELVTRAGGFKDTARGNAVIITRISPDGKRETIGPLDISSMIRGRERAEVEATSLLLQPNDIVYVPMRII